MNIAVVGTGYVGLVGGVCMADMGHDVICVDIDETKVTTLREGKTPIYEPGLEKLLKKTLKAGKVAFTTSLADAVKQAEVVFLALPTPPGENGEADLSYILQVAEDLGPLTDHEMVIVDKSTVPVGTAEKVRQKIAEHAAAPFEVVSNPEFLREGHALHDFMYPDRIVVGTDSDEAREKLRQLYAPIAKPEKILEMDVASAELTKYAANTFLATKVTFMNEIANICDALGADVEAVRIGIGSDERIGPHFLQAGIGYGGSCFPKDVQALLKTAKSSGYEFKLLKALIEANTKQKRRLIEMAMDHFEDLRDKQIALWGLAFKPNTDDIREAPAIEIIHGLLEKGARVVAYDPEAAHHVKRLLGELPGLSFARDMYEAVTDADALFIATEWDIFKEVDFSKLKELLNGHVIFDGRNIFHPHVMKEHGMVHYPIGRPSTLPQPVLEQV